MNPTTTCVYKSTVTNSLRRAPRLSGSVVVTRLRTAALSYSPSYSRTLHISSRATATQHTSRVHTRTYSLGAGGSVQTLPDPDRPDLFYHLFPAPTSISSSAPVFALSFLPDPPPSVLSCVVVGWLPASGTGDEAGLNDFVENERFREVLHSAVQSALRDGVDEVQKNGAIQTREGWMHIHDSRNLPALGRIGDPDDIIASVRVENSEMLMETYQPMPSYRMCTADGVLQLTDGLMARLVETLKAKIQEEEQ